MGGLPRVGGPPGRGPLRREPGQLRRVADPAGLLRRLAGPHGRRPVRPRLGQRLRGRRLADDLRRRHRRGDEEHPPPPHRRGLCLEQDPRGLPDGSARDDGRPGRRPADEPLPDDLDIGQRRPHRPRRQRGRPLRDQPHHHRLRVGDALPPGRLLLHPRPPAQRHAEHQLGRPVGRLHHPARLRLLRLRPGQSPLQPPVVQGRRHRPERACQLAAARGPADVLGRGLRGLVRRDRDLAVAVRPVGPGPARRRRPGHRDDRRDPGADRRRHPARRGQGGHQRPQALVHRLRHGEGVRHHPDRDGGRPARSGHPVPQSAPLPGRDEGEDRRRARELRPGLPGRRVLPQQLRPVPGHPDHDQAPTRRSGRARPRHVDRAGVPPS